MGKPVNIVDSYRAAARSEEVAAWNYRGLTIHAIPVIHEIAGEILKDRLFSGAQVLDLAAGSGAMCLRLRDLGFNVTGTDLVAENFRLHDQVPFRTLDLNDPLPGEMLNAFDGVTALELIEHLENPRHLIRQCFSALRPGGILLVSTPNVESPISLAQFIRTGDFRWFTADSYHRDGHITPLPIAVLTRALIEAGFEEHELYDVADLSFRGFAWWKMRLLAFAINMLSGRKLMVGDIIVCVAKKPLT